MGPTEVAKAKTPAYDFDSDEDDLDESPPEFYDADLDDKDAAWMYKQRGGRSSDAILSCPCCLETVCLDCQRHELYHMQFRAMFVRNVQVQDKLMTTPAQRLSKQRQASQTSAGQGHAPQPQDNEHYRSVECSTCGTEVAMLDKDSVYHFFNVFPTGA
eukprot:jgi/Chlat1/178/Chrsp1S03250